MPLSASCRKALRMFALIIPRSRAHEAELGARAAAAAAVVAAAAAGLASGELSGCRCRCRVRRHFHPIYRCRGIRSCGTTNIAASRRNVVRAGRCCLARVGRPLAVTGAGSPPTWGLIRTMRRDIAGDGRCVRSGEALPMATGLLPGRVGRTEGLPGIFAGPAVAASLDVVTI
jgi:hypothetical protein